MRTVFRGLVILTAAYVGFRYFGSTTGAVDIALPAAFSAGGMAWFLTRPRRRIS